MFPLSSGILVRTTHHLAFPPLQAGGRRRRRKVRWGVEDQEGPSPSPVLVNAPLPTPWSRGLVSGGAGTS